MLLFSLLTLTVAAQGVFSNKTNAALKKVIEDYPNRFSNIKGDKISSIDPAVNYKSKVTIAGSANCTLTHSKADEYSWKCELFTAVDFEKAKSRYNDLYNEIHNTIIKLEGEKPVILNGQYATPEKDRKQNSIFFHFLPNTGLIQKLNVELQLQSVNGTWTITLAVYERPEAGSLKSEV
jgi:hypothetical protein